MDKLPEGVVIIPPGSDGDQPAVSLSGTFRLREMVNILRALELATGVAPEQRMGELDVLVSSLVDSDDLTPWVAIENFHLDQPLQIPASSAAELAYNLLTASEAALQDATLMLFMRERGMTKDRAAEMLIALRGFRSQLENDEPKEDDQ